MNASGIGKINSINKRIAICNYLSVAQIFLQDNFLLERPLEFKDIKPRLLGHWGSCPGINIAYANLKATFPQMDFVLGPGHGFPALQANLFYDNELIATDKKATRDRDGLNYICRNFSWAYGFPSHASPMTPGVITEGGELGYALGAAYGAVLGKPEKSIAILIGDGELETATALSSLHLNRLLSNKYNGKILPILHLNGYKISAPTIYARKSERELNNLIRGFGFEPVSVDGTDTESFQNILMSLPENAFIIMRTPKGYTGPKTFDGKKIEDNYLAHQVPLAKAKSDKNQLKMLESWLKSYQPEKIFKEFFENPSEKRAEQGETQNLDAPKTDALVSMPSFVEKPGAENTSIAHRYGELLRSKIASDPNFYFFSPDETTSNRLDAIFDVTKRSWNAKVESWDLALDEKGQVIEMLSENTLFAVLAGHILSGGSGAMTSYESFFSIISSQLDQHLKFLAQSKSIPWRKDVEALNLFSTSCWQRQDHNGYTHQSPALISNLLNKPSNLANCFFPCDDVAAAASWDYMNASENVVNLTTFNKIEEPRWIDANHARFQLENGGASIFGFCSDDAIPDFVLSGVGDISTAETIRAIDLIKSEIPEIKLRYVGIAALSYGAIGTTDNKLLQSQFDDYFTLDKPIIVNFHGYPDTLRAILARYTDTSRVDILGYEDEGSTTTPLDELARNHCSRYDVAICVFERLGRYDLADKFREKLQENARHAKETGEDLY